MSDLSEIYRHFWYAEESEVLSGASKDTIARKEDELSVKLPDELKQLMMISDGGVVQVGLGEGDDWISLPNFFDLDTLELSSYESSDYDYKEARIPERVIILGSHGHDFYALDYRTESVPSVIYGDGSGDIEVVASSFREFVANLSMEDDDEEGDTHVSWKLIHENTLDAAKELVEQFGLEWRSEYDLTLCQIAASDGVLTTLQCLIEMGADPSGSLKFAEANKKQMVVDYLRTNRIVP